MGKIILDKAYVGSSEVDKIYLGTELVYQSQKGIPIEEAPSGVYILRTDNLLYTQDDWDTSWNDESVGVAVLSSDCKFVISKIQGGKMKWGGEDVMISGVVSASELDTAKTDYAGKDNTDKIIDQLGASNAPAANYCKNTIGLFPDGRQGYLGAFGEWQKAYDHKSYLDSCLSTIGGDAIATDECHLSSTQSSRAGYVWVLYWGSTQIATNPKSRDFRVRAFATL